MVRHVQITGTAQLEKKFKEIADAPAQLAARKVMRQAARLTQSAIKTRAPKKTGRLKRSIKIKSAKRHWQDPESPEYVVAVNWRIAPHAHIVEYGHANVRGGKRDPGRWWRKKGKVIGAVGGIRYFQRGIDASRGQATRTIVEGAKKIIDKAWNKK